MRARIAIVVLGVASTLAGCNPPRTDTEYPVSVQEGLARLDKADVTGFRNARQCGLLIHFVNYRQGENGRRWGVHSSGRELLSFSVTLIPVENKVRADISVPKTADGGELYDGKQNYTHPALMQPLRPAVREMINAAMEKRSFDWRRLPEPLNIGPARTMSNCSTGQQVLERGFPMSLNDPERAIPREASAAFGWTR